MSKASDEIIKKSKAIREISTNPLAIMQGILPIAMNYMKTGQITRSGGVEMASRILAIIELVDNEETPTPVIKSQEKFLKPINLPTK